MAADTSATVRLTRLLALVPWLRTHDGVTVTAAAAHFGVTEDELGRDLDLLICTGPGQYHGELLDIVYDEGRISVLDAQTLDRPLRFTGQEAAALSVGLRVLADTLGVEGQEVLDGLRAKIENAATAALPGRVQWSTTDVPDDATLQTVAGAIGDGHALEIEYASATADAISTRIVDPIRVMWLDGRAYLIGWCRSAQGRRTFRVDRIASVRRLDEPAHQHAETSDVNPDTIEPVGDEVIVVLAARASTAFEEYPVQRVVGLPDGGAEVTLQVSDPRWIARVLLRLGDGVVSVQPAAVAELVATQARTALASYDD